MDTPTITHLSLCSGYGGIDLGLRRAIGSSLRTVAYAEIEAFACELLLARMEGQQIDPAPIWPDLKSFPWESFRDRVDILSGGYPCQPFSAAGKRLGKDDPRHLWPFIADGIQVLRPRLCFFENVEGHISLGLRDVIEELGRLGYAATWGVFSASEVGAPHQRKRVFILANDQRERIEELGRQVSTNAEQRAARNHGSYAWPSRPGEPQHGWEPPRVVGNAASRKDDGRESGDVGEEAGQGRRGYDAIDCASEGVGNTQGQRSAALRPEHERLGGQLRASGSGCEGVVGDSNGINRSTPSEGREHDAKAGQAGERQAQSSMGRDSHGTSDWMDYAELCISCDNRTDELRLLGNGVVPATAERAFLALLQQLQCHSTSR
jgi:DNA (cytosine-5)-methyltransferase 1